MTNKEMADFLLELRNRQEMPIDEDEYYLIGDIADRLMAGVDIEPTEPLDREKTIKGLEALQDAMSKNQCYACSHEFVDAADEFGSNIIYDAITLLKEQEAKPIWRE